MGNIDMQDGASPVAIIVVNTILAAVSIISIGIRCHRPNSKQRGLDAQTVMLGLGTFCGVTMSILQCIATKYGLGMHMEDLSLKELESLLKLYPAIMSFYYACNMFVKFGLLIFYLRTTYQRKYLYAIWFMIIAAFVFGVSNVFVICFECVPLRKIWTPNTPGTCINVLAFYWANSIIMIVNDTIMYIMPVVFFWNIPLLRSQRIVLNVLFGLGAFVVATSVLRFLAVARFSQSHGDLPYHLASVLLWSAVENHIAVFIACTPSIKALVVAHLGPYVSTIHSSFNERFKSLRGSNANNSVVSFGCDSRGAPGNSNHYSIGRVQQEFSRRVLGNNPPTRGQSIASDNDDVDLTRTRETRSDSTTTDDTGITRNVSECSMNKGFGVVVVPRENLN